MRVKVGFWGGYLGFESALQVQKRLLEKQIEAELIEVKEKQRPLLSFLDIKSSELWKWTENGKIDLALWSGSDGSAMLHQDEWIASLKRQDPRDCLVSKSDQFDVDNFAQSWRIGLLSERQAVFIQHYFPHLVWEVNNGSVLDLINKLKEGLYDGILLSCSVAKQKGLQTNILRKINTHIFTPTIGEGALIVTGRLGFPHRKSIQSALNHPATDVALKAEYAFKESGSIPENMPVVGLGTVVGDHLSLLGGVAALDGRIWRSSIDGHIDDAIILGQKLATQITSKLTN